MKKSFMSKFMTPLSNQEGEVLIRSIQIYIVKNDDLPLKYNNLINGVTTYSVCSKQCSRHCQRNMGQSTGVSSL